MTEKIIQQEKEIILKVFQNSQGQKLLFVPRKSFLVGGDWVLISKLNIQDPKIEVVPHENK